MCRNALSMIVCAGLFFQAGCSGDITTDTAKMLAPVNGALPMSSAEPAQTAAADALGRIGQPAVQSLSDALTDSNAMVRLQACKALAFMGAEASNAVPALIRTLNDPEEAVRIQAANALGQIGAPAQPAVAPLMQMLRGQR
jgi:HEAT repeat protein